MRADVKGARLLVLRPRDAHLPRQVDALKARNLREEGVPLRSAALGDGRDELLEDGAAIEIP